MVAVLVEDSPSGIAARAAARRNAESGAPRLTRHLAQERGHLGRRSQMVNALLESGLGDERPVLGRQVPVAPPEHAIAADRAADHRAPLGPSFGCDEQALEE